MVCRVVVLRPGIVCLVRLMVTDGAASGRPKHGMMPGKMPGNAADDGALDTSLRVTMAR